MCRRTIGCVKNIKNKIMCIKEYIVLYYSVRLQFYIQCNDKIHDILYVTHAYFRKKKDIITVEFRLVRNNIDVNEPERLSNIPLRHK